MAEKSHQTNGSYPRRDDEMSTSDAAEIRRKKRIKISIYIAVFIVFQIAVISVFGLVVMRAKSPKLRLGNSFGFEKLETLTSPSPSFDTSFTAQVRMKNPNFGPYKYDDTTVIFAYGGATVGQVAIPKSKVGMKGTKKITVRVSLDSKQLANNTNLGSELGTGTLTLTSTAKMTGKAELVMIMKKKKSAQMNCTLVIDVAAKNLKSLHCI